MIAVASACTLHLIKEVESADLVATAVRRSLRLACKAAYCEEHDAYHVKLDESRVKIDQKHKRVLEMLAAGLRDQEIANELGITYWEVVHSIDRLCRRLNAMSRPNLVAIAAMLGLIDTSIFVARIQEEA